MSFPTFEASFLAARQGRQSRAHHRCFPNTVNRGVNKPRPHRLNYPLSPTDSAQEPFSRAPFAWRVGDTSLGNVDETTGNTTTYTSSGQPSVNTIYVSDADGRSGQIRVEQL
jgi:hypothetical protein